MPRREGEDGCADHGAQGGAGLRSCLLRSWAPADLHEERSRETPWGSGLSSPAQQGWPMAESPSPGESMKTGSSLKCTEPVPAGLLCRPLQGKR